MGISIHKTRSHVGNILVWISVAIFLFTAPTAFAATPSDPSQACDSVASSCSCSDALDLQRRVARAVSIDDGGSLTDEGRSLRATLEDVLTEQECMFLMDALPSNVFVDAGGYESTSNQYTASRNGYSGIGLRELAMAVDPGDQSKPVVFRSKADYDRFLEFRERVRAATERSLNLCPGTLKIDYTHISQKTPGGTHRPHADNCFHYYRSISGGRVAAAVDPSRKHPYANRVAASILYLNDDGFDGGEFYWADRTSEEGTPETIVAPRKGRMTVFTSGIENLHGALPVREGADPEKPARRLALAMWYVTESSSEESVPVYGAVPAGRNEEEEDPNRTVLFEIPVDSIKIGSLRLALGLYLVGKQNTPAKGSWRANQNNENTLHMIFKDQTAMVSIALYNEAIVVSRHTDGIRRPSLQYQLQESVMLHGILTELETLAYGMAEGQSNNEEDRLVRIEPAAIDKARSTLPTRR